MADHPIIFSAPMIRALLDGRKSMTRRLRWKEVHRGTHPEGRPALCFTNWNKVQPGDRLWVRESCRRDGDFGAYAVDGAHVLTPSWTDGTSMVAPEWRMKGKACPSIHMPRWASRLTLVVIATKIERLQDISDQDAVAEGIERAAADDNWWRDYGGVLAGLDHPVLSFASLWASLHGLDSWEANPEVVALSFTVEKRNIDYAGA